MLRPARSMFPGIRYAGRLVSDPPGNLGQGEATMFTGTGSQTGTNGRWGDYSYTAIDPSDGMSFWTLGNTTLTPALSIGTHVSRSFNLLAVAVLPDAGRAPYLQRPALIPTPRHAPSPRPRPTPPPRALRPPFTVIPSGTRDHSRVPCNMYSS